MLPGRICFVLLLTAAVAAHAFAQKPSEKYVPNEVLVKFSPERGEAAASAIRSGGSQLLERFGTLRWQRVRVPAGQKIEDVLKRLARIPGVEAVQPNYYYELQAAPNDPRFEDAGMYGLTKISAPQAWDITTGSPSVVVANIDTGVRYTHEDLAANMWTNQGEINNNGLDDDGNGFVDDYYGYDFFFNDGDPADEHGHGTNTAGTIGAAGNNGLGISGVNWSVRIMNIKIYDADGFGTTSAMLINAYNYIRMMKLRGVNIRVTNNSYAGCDEACGYDQATKDALDAMGDAGILNVFAAGNDGRNTDVNPAYPGSYTSPSVINVAASTVADERNPISNFGVGSVDLAAPGSGILTTAFSSDSSYVAQTGTSMAAPHVTGVAALLASHNPALTVASLKASILNNADSLSGWQGVVKTGGRLNAAKALQNQTVCIFNLSSTGLNVGTKGGYYTIDVGAAANCDFSVKSSANWIQINDGARSGNGTVTFRIPISPVLNRTGTITIAGQNVTVTQTRGIS